VRQSNGDVRVQIKGILSGTESGVCRDVDTLETLVWQEQLCFQFKQPLIV